MVEGGRQIGSGDIEVEFETVVVEAEAEAVSVPEVGVEDVVGVGAETVVGLEVGVEAGPREQHNCC